MLCKLAVHLVPVYSSPKKPSTICWYPPILSLKVLCCNDCELEILDGAAGISI